LLHFLANLLTVYAEIAIKWQMIKSGPLLEKNQLSGSFCCCSPANRQRAIFGLIVTCRIE